MIGLTLPNRVRDVLLSLDKLNINIRWMLDHCIGYYEESMDNGKYICEFICEHHIMITIEDTDTSTQACIKMMHDTDVDKICEIRYKSQP